jgi:hypothetical protein
MVHGILIGWTHYYSISRQMGGGMPTALLPWA